MSEPNWVPIGAVAAVGDELAYATKTTTTSVTATTEAAANEIVAAPAITTDGVGAILVEFFAQQVGPANTAGASITFWLYQDGVSIGAIGRAIAPTAAAVRFPVQLQRRLTPTAASHIYSIRASVSTGTGQVIAGTGVITTDAPTFIRISTVRSTGVGGAATPSCRVRRATNQAISNGAEQPIYFDIEDFDTDGMHDTVTDSDRITIKTAGKYLMIATLQFSYNLAGTRAVGIKLNGGVNYLAYTFVPTPGTAVVSAQSIYDFAVNDYIQVLGYQDSGGALDVAYAAVYSPMCSMHKIN